MTNMITAAEILARFEKGQTDFRDLGECSVKGYLDLQHHTINDNVCLGYLTFESGFDCHSATFNGAFTCMSATFNGAFYCGSATFLDPVYAGENPAIAWVIQQYKMAGVHYNIEHAPPWMQRPALQS